MHVDDPADCGIGDGEDESSHSTPITPSVPSMSEFTAFFDDQVEEFSLLTTGKDDAQDNAQEEDDGSARPSDHEAKETISEKEAVTTHDSPDFVCGDSDAGGDTRKADTEAAADSTSHDDNTADTTVPSHDGHTTGPEYEPYKEAYDDEEPKGSCVSVSVTYHPDGSVTQHSHFPSQKEDESEAVYQPWDDEGETEQEPEPEEEPEQEPELEPEDEPDDINDYDDDYVYDDDGDQDY